MSRTILVIGGAGFIGSHAVQALLERGDAVVALDKIYTYYRSGKRQRMRSAAAVPTIPTRWSR